MQNQINGQTLAEKRGHKRYRCSMPIRFNLNKSVSTAGIGKLLDLGKGGARLFAPGQFQPGDHLKLRFGSKPVDNIETEAKVVWTGEAGMGTFGVHFLSMPDTRWKELHCIIRD